MPNESGSVHLDDLFNFVRAQYDTGVADSTRALMTKNFHQVRSDRT